MLLISISLSAKPQVSDLRCFYLYSGSLCSARNESFEVTVYLKK